MTSWTNVNDLITTLRKRWATGRYLSDYAGNVAWTPIELPVKAPLASELLDQFDEAVRWAEGFQRDSHTGGGAARFAVTYRTVKGKNLGANSVPGRVRIESFEQLCALIGTNRDVRSLDVIMRQTETALKGWATTHGTSSGIAVSVCLIITSSERTSRFVPISAQSCSKLSIRTRPGTELAPRFLPLTVRYVTAKRAAPPPVWLSRWNPSAQRTASSN